MGQAVAKLSDAQIASALKQVPDWGESGDAIQRTYQFPDFVRSMAFVSAVATEAEKAQHHPDILIRYSRVTLTLSTHDAGGITIKDFELATRCDRLAQSVVGPAVPPKAAAPRKPKPTL